MRFFERSLSDDPLIAEALAAERARQGDGVELIASENFASPAVLAAQGSVLTNKYAEGYPGRRFFGGCEQADVVERAAVSRACALFGSAHANVQPHSGAQANGAVMLALLKPGDTVLGMSPSAGGHITHGTAPARSGRWFTAVQYGVRPEDGRIDYDQAAALAELHRPKLIIAGGSAIPRQIDFARFRAIADQVGARLMVDMAHIAGLVAGGAHPSPMALADVVTSTTHKTLRGPRGGLILSNDHGLANRFNSAVFPGLQGGPHMHVVAAKAIAFGEALRPDFTLYAHETIANARILADTLMSRGHDVVTGGTDTHMVLLDLRRRKLAGLAAEHALGRIGITCNKNGVPLDPLPPSQTSGIRLGASACTTRGFRKAEFVAVGDLVADVLDQLGADGELPQPVERDFRARALALARRFPLYP